MLLSRISTQGRWGAEAARKYNEETKHSYVSIRTAPGFLDFANKPYPFKYYVGGEKSQLPDDFWKPSEDALRALSCRGSESAAAKALNTSLLSSLLYFTAGISRVERLGDRRVYFRVAPATGALYSTELYTVVGEVEGVSPGVYHFDPGEFTLHRLRRGDYRGVVARAAQDGGLSVSPVVIVFSAYGWRNAWKYRERSYRHWFWDGGAMLANSVAAVCSMGLNHRLFTGFVDEKLNELIGVDGLDEAAYAVLAVGYKDGLGRFDSADYGLGELEASPAPQRGKPHRYWLVTETHTATALHSEGDVVTWREAVKQLEDIGKDIRRLGIQTPMPGPATQSKTLWETILLRGSTRRFSRKSIDASQLSTILRHSFGPLNADFLPSPNHTLIRPHLIVNNVDGVPSGAYSYDPSTGNLILLKKGHFREAAGYLCLEQPLGRDAAVVFFNMADLDSVLRVLGGRGYRAVQLEGGIRLGRLYLSSYALGLGATGLTFYDDDCVEFFSPSSEGLEMITVVAIGHPDYSAKPGKIFTRALTHPAKAF